MLHILIFLISVGARAVRTMCRRRADLVLENLALRKQLAALKAENKEKEKAFASQSKTLEGQLKKQEADFEAKLANAEAAKVTSDQLAREMTAEKEAALVKLEVAEKEIAKLSESSGATNAALTEQNAKLEESLEKAEKELKKKDPFIYK